MGSEIVLEVQYLVICVYKWLTPCDEVWRTDLGQYFVRILHEGTSVPHLEWVDLNDFISLLEEQIPENIYETCMAQ